MEIDLFAEPPTVKEIEAARRELENSRLLILQNEAFVANLYHKLVVKSVVIALILIIALLLYFILPGDVFGMADRRATLLVTLSSMLMASLLWISWRTWKQARSIIPGRGNSKEQMQRLKSRMLGLADVDVKLRLNVVNWSRADGVLTQYVKKITRQHRHIIGLEYLAIKNHIKQASSH